MTQIYTRLSGLGPNCFSHDNAKEKNSFRIQGTGLARLGSLSFLVCMASEISFTAKDLTFLLHPMISIRATRTCEQLARTQLYGERAD